MIEGIFRSLTGWEPLLPESFWLLLFIPFALWVRRRGGRPHLRFGLFPHLGRGARAGDAQPLPQTWRTRLIGLPLLIELAGLVALVCALAAPVERVLLPFERAGVDVLLCLDVSSSMGETDMAAGRTRLDVARSGAVRFAAARPEDHLGILSFARFPDLVCPLTRDARAVESLLARLELIGPDDPEDATAIGTALTRGAELLDARDTLSRVIILWTDGVENVATPGRAGEIAPLHAAELCAQRGIRVYCVLAGAPAREGAERRFEIDAGSLESLARRTEGRFFRATDADAVEEVFSAIDRLERSPYEEPRYGTEPRHGPFLVAGLVLLLLAWILRGTLFEELAR